MSDIKSIGLVPTMGALHSGHISLVKQCKNNNDLTVVSIFVNPTQFNNSTDFEKYPITIDADLALLKSSGCDVVFLPSKEEIYPIETLLKINFGYLESILEGECRPGHFNGVGIVVSKLFNIVKPDKAYFGQKDLQQFLVIKQLVNDLSIPVKLEMCDIERDHKGLALSSRNSRLSKTGLEKARKINLLLKEAIATLKTKKNLTSIKPIVEIFIKENPGIEIEYLKVVDASTLIELTEYNNTSSKAICIASFIEKVRLIDNTIFE